MSATGTGPGAPRAQLRLRRLGIATYRHSFIYMRDDCPVCRAEGFAPHTPLKVSLRDRSITASLAVVTTDLLGHDEAALSDAGWQALGAQCGDVVLVEHAPSIDSLRRVRAKLYGVRLDDAAVREIVTDIVAGRYADVHLAAFVTACAGDRLDRDETLALTRAMAAAGDRLKWSRPIVIDKHSVGGLPGNRTTPIVVAIAAAAGMTIPKTSSRAITSAAGTADTMETLAPVNLTPAHMRRVVEQEGGCIVWSGALNLSPADDTIVAVERALDIDSEGQLVASVLSKKLAAGSTHVVIDMPVGPTAKVRSVEAASVLAQRLVATGRALGLVVEVAQGDGRQPIGRGIGPSLEARDVIAVLQRSAQAPVHLRERALALAGRLLELGGVARDGEGLARAAGILDGGQAWRKFVAICDAQGGAREPPTASFHQPIVAPMDGVVAAIDCRRLARAAKLTGAPASPASGIEYLAPLGTRVARDQPLFVVHAMARGELDYALAYLERESDIVTLDVSA